MKILSWSNANIKDIIWLCSTVIIIYSFLRLINLQISSFLVILYQYLLAYFSNMSLFDCLLASGGDPPPPPLRSRKLLDVWPWIFLPDVKLSEEARDRKFFWHNLTGLWIIDRIPKNQNFRNANSRHTNFTTFCKIINIDVWNWSWKFQIYIFKNGYFTEQSLKLHQMLFCKIQNGL